MCLITTLGLLSWSGADAMTHSDDFGSSYSSPPISSIIIFQSLGPGDLARDWLRIGPTPAQDSLRTIKTLPPSSHDLLLLS